jgi:hypothetical protein
MLMDNLIFQFQSQSYDNLSLWLPWATFTEIWVEISEFFQHWRSLNVFEAPGVH